MSSPTQYVTLVAQGGTPVRLADQTGAPYPTTGSGALVFSDNPTLNNPHIPNPYGPIDLSSLLPSSGPVGAAFQALLNTYGNNTYYLGKGTYDFADVVVTVPALFNIELHPEAYIRNGRIIHSTTNGPEVPLTSAVTVGSLDIPVDNTVLGAAAGDDLYLMGCTDLLSADAGASRLGARQSAEANPMYAGERVRVYSATSSTVTVGGNQGGTIFPYEITPGPNSGTRTVSTIRKCTPGIMRWVGGEMQRGASSAVSSPIVFRLTAGAYHVIDTRITFDQDQLAGFAIYAERVFAGDFKVDVKRKLVLIGSGGSSSNSVIFAGSQQTYVSGRVSGGGQAFDITHALDGTGVASVQCGARNLYVFDATEAATDHQGNYESSFIGVRWYATQRGLRLRSPKALVQDVQGVSRYLGQGIGINIANGWTDGCVIDGAIIDGHTIGMTVDRANTDVLAESPDAPPRIIGRAISIHNAVTGVQFNNVYSPLSNAQLRAVGHADFDVAIHNCQQPVLIDSYWNGIDVHGSIHGAPTSYGVSFPSNISNLTIGPFVLHDLGGAAVGVLGPGTGVALVPNATVWPAGEIEANLRIAELSVIGTPPSALVSGLTLNNTLPLGSAREIIRREVRGSLGVVSDNGTELNIVSDIGLFAGAQPDAFVELFPYITDFPTLKSAFGVLFNAAPFTPEDIPVALTYSRFDYEETAQITTSGGLITDFIDPISTGTWTQGTAGARPALDATGFNGRQCGTFDGGDSLRNTDAVATLGWPTGGAFEYWALVQYTGPLGVALDNAVIFQYPAITTNTSFSLSVINLLGATRRYRVRAGTGASSVAITNTTADLMDGQPHIARFVSTGTTIRLDVDGAGGTPVACVAAFAGGPVHTIGGDSAGTSANLFTGKMNFLGFYHALPVGLANALYRSLNVRRTP